MISTEGLGPQHGRVESDALKRAMVHGLSGLWRKAGWPLRGWLGGEFRCPVTVAEDAAGEERLSGAEQYQEEAVDEDVEEEGRKLVARIVVAPEADLQRGYDAGVDEEEGVE
jgi:hypothetical protein